MNYSKEKSGAISFPLGGIGAGCIGLGGNGSLIDWEIFNSANKRSRNGISHFAVRAEQNGKVTDFRILNGDLTPPYEGEGVKPNALFYGMGFGPSEETLCNLPHFRKHAFEGAYPIAEINFSGEKFPASPTLTAWSVFIPGESKDSSLPAAFFEIDLENTSAIATDFTVIGTLANPWASNATHYNRVEGSQLTVYSGDNAGEVSLTAYEEADHISHQTYFYQGGWRDHIESYVNDIMAGGRFAERFYEGSPTVSGGCPGLLAVHFCLNPGEKKTTRFVITWHIPVCRADWDSETEKHCAEAGIQTTWKNYYAVVWSNSRDSGSYALREYDRLRTGTFLLRDTLFASNLPKSIMDGVSACLSVLKSPTCLRLEDGTFWGWEGVGTTWGSCFGSCSHVWNYAQALPFLFPDLEKSMRESHLRFSVDENGGSHFRIYLPLGIHATVDFMRPCADGQFGDVMKIYRDWKISGDTEYVKRRWPAIRKTIEYAWSERNPDRWDPDKSGVLTGRQHHTLDMELFGPNAWLTGHYLGALLAGAKLAEAAGDTEFACVCRKIFSRGFKWVDENLFNGEYYTQKIDMKDRSVVDRFDAPQYWNDERGEIKYQIGEGCAIDTPLAQLYATIYGIGMVFDRNKLHKTLRSIFKNNFKRSMRDVVNSWRVYSMNDEGGVMICTWPQKRPAIPLTYNSETMTGFEWAFADQLVAEGMVDEGVEVASAIRGRFDGHKRNPWNEFECGSNYARSMAAYGMIPAFAGFSYDYAAGMLGFAPKQEPITVFWALGAVWGLFSQSATEAKLELRHGTFDLRVLKLSFESERLELNGNAVSLPVALNAGDILTVKR